MIRVLSARAHALPYHARMPVFDLILLILQAASAVLLLHLTARLLLPALRESDSSTERRRMFDVWLPLILSAPAAAASINTSFGALTTGALGIAVPVGATMIAAGAAILRAQPTLLDPDRSRLTQALLSAAAAGGLLLLLAAADRLSILVGQVAFAIWAVLLWTNAPSEHPQREPVERDRSEDRIALSLLALAAIAVLQSVIIALLTMRSLPIAGGLCALQTTMTFALILLYAGSGAAVRAALWTAIYGLFLSIGLVSLATLIRASWPLLDREANLALHYGPAHGYGAFAIEAVLLVITVTLLAVQHRMGGFPRKAVALAWILGGAALIGWRLVVI
jgi:hypothetical protein